MAATATSTGTGNWSADATWAITGIGDSSGVDGDLNSGVLDCTGDTPGFTVDALIGRRVQLAGGTWYTITDNDANTITIADPPADGDPLTWLLGGPSLATDIVVIATGHVITDDVARIPAAAGTLASLTFQGTGYLTTALASSQEIYATTITAGTVAAIRTSGSTAGVFLDIHATTITGGSANDAPAILPGQTGVGSLVRVHVTNGNAGTAAYCSILTAQKACTVDGAVGGVDGPCTITGGAGANRFGIGMWTGPLTITGTATNPVSIVGGSHGSAFGLGEYGGTFVAPTLNYCNLIGSANCIACNTKPPVWNITGKANYIQMPTVNADARGSQIMRFYLPPTGDEVIAPTAGGFEDGADPPAYAAAGTLSLDNVLVAGGGNYVEPVAAEIWDAASGGTAYGAAGGFGTFDLLADQAAQFALGQVDQLAADVVLVAAQGDFIVAGTDFTAGLGVVGNLAVADILDSGTGTAAGGTYVEPVNSEVLDAASGGTAYGPGGLIAGTFDLIAAEAAAAAASHAADSAFLETNKDEIIIADTDIEAEFGVTGTAAGGAGVRHGGALRGA